MEKQRKTEEDQVKRKEEIDENNKDKMNKMTKHGGETGETSGGKRKEKMHAGRNFCCYLDNSTLISSSKTEIAQVWRAELNVSHTFRAAAHEGLTHQSFPDILFITITYPVHPEHPAKFETVTRK